MYIGLLIGSNEPSPSTGYARVEGDLGQNVAFPLSEGYGMVTHIALYDSADADRPVDTIALPEPVDVHAGVIPLVHNGQLFRGLDVTGHVTIRAAGNAKL